jgi:hypothetical protein
METEYNGYWIEILTEQVHNECTFRSLVFVPDGSSQTIKRFSYHGPRFVTKKEAELQGLLLVEKWIDDGMPEIQVPPTRKN